MLPALMKPVLACWAKHMKVIFRKKESNTKKTICLSLSPSEKYLYMYDGIYKIITAYK